MQGVEVPASRITPAAGNRALSHLVLASKKATFTMTTSTRSALALTGLATLATLGLGVSAQAQTITTGLGPVTVGNSFQTSYGKDGYVLLATTPAGTNYKYQLGVTSGDLGNSSFVSNSVADPLTAAGTPTKDSMNKTIVNAVPYSPLGMFPSYVMVTDSAIVVPAGTPGAVNTFIEAGNNYDSITPTLEAGFGGTLNTGSNLNVLQFTLTGSNVPTTFTFGVLADFNGPNTGPLRLPAFLNTPGSFQLSGPGGSVASYTDNGGADNEYLFTINKAAAGQVYTLAMTANPGSGTAVASGYTFDSPAPAAVPEASTTISFGLFLALGVGGMVIAAKRKKAVAF